MSRNKKKGSEKRAEKRECGSCLEDKDPVGGLDWGGTWVCYLCTLVPCALPDDSDDWMEEAPERAAA